MAHALAQNGKPAARRNKYGAIPTVANGIRFASKAEAKRYEELLLLQRAGEISALQLQPRYPLFVNEIKIGVYTGDFAYFDKSGMAVVEDVKSKATAAGEAFRLRKKLTEAIYGITIQEVGK
jgi:hypothetical protein